MRVHTFIDREYMHEVIVVAKNKRKLRATSQEHKVVDAEIRETTMGTEVLQDGITSLRNT